MHKKGAPYGTPYVKYGKRYRLFSSGVFTIDGRINGNTRAHSRSNRYRLYILTLSSSWLHTKNLVIYCTCLLYTSRCV